MSLLQKIVELLDSKAHSQVLLLRNLKRPPYQPLGQSPIIINVIRSERKTFHV